MIHGFGGYLSSVFPSQLVVDVTEFCNLACIHCPYEAVTRPKGKLRANLDPALHAAMVTEVGAAGRGICRYIRYTGEGEPTLHPKLTEFFADAKARTGAMVALTTNGLLLDAARRRDLLDAGVDVIDISLDAFRDDTYAKIRVKGELPVAREYALKLIEETRGTNTKVMLSYVDQPLNQGEAQPFKEFWEAKGADFVVLRRTHSCAGSIDDIAQRMWREAPVPRKPCLYPWERLTLGPDGRIVFCPTDWLGRAVIGHLAEESLQSVWQGPKMEALRQAHLTNSFANHEFCGQCPDWSVTRWPHEGRSYATVMHEFEGERRDPS